MRKKLHKTRNGQLLNYQAFQIIWTVLMCIGMLLANIKLRNSKVTVKGGISGRLKASGIVNKK